MKIRNAKQSQLRLAISPTPKTPESDWEEPPTLSQCPESPAMSGGRSFKLSSSCAGNLDLDVTMTMRSARHQSRIRNAGMQIAIKLIYKYRARSISELFDKCTADEFSTLIYQCANYQKVIIPALELFVKDSLEIQRRDRWSYMLSFAKFNYDEEKELLNLLIKQHINPVEFAKNLKSVFMCSQDKINCVRLYGVANSGKSLIFQLLSSCFITCYANNHGSENEFYMSNFLNKSLILCEELYVTQATCEDFKSILGGANIDIAKKYSEKQILSRTPVLITSNFELFGRGHLSPIDENALQSRCISYKFSSSFTPKVHITAPSMFHFLWLCENQDIL